MEKFSLIFTLLSIFICDGIYSKETHRISSKFETLLVLDWKPRVLNCQPDDVIEYNLKSLKDENGSSAWTEELTSSENYVLSLKPLRVGDTSCSIISERGGIRSFDLKLSKKSKKEAIQLRNRNVLRKNGPTVNNHTKTMFESILLRNNLSQFVDITPKKKALKTYSTTTAKYKLEYYGEKKGKYSLWIFQSKFLKKKRLPGASLKSRGKILATAWNLSDSRTRNFINKGESTRVYILAKSNIKLELIYAYLP